MLHCSGTAAILDLSAFSEAPVPPIPDEEIIREVSTSATDVNHAPSGSNRDSVIYESLPSRKKQKKKYLREFLVRIT